MTDHLNKIVVDDKEALPETQKTEQPRPIFNPAEDVEVYSDQKEFDEKVEDLIRQGYVPYDTVTNSGDFFLFMTQQFTHKKKVLLFPGGSIEDLLPDNQPELF